MREQWILEQEQPYDRKARSLHQYIWIDRSATVWAMRDEISEKYKTDRYIVQLNSFGHITPETQLINHGTWPNMDQKKKKKP